MRFNSARARLTAGLLSLLFGVGVMAQEATSSNMDILREKLEADKKLVVAENMVLTESQAQAFWPIYDEYQAELQTINQRLARLILDYAEVYNTGAVTDAQAKPLLDEFIAVQEAEVALQKKYAARLSGVISTKEAARYLQIENKIRSVIKFDLAANVPLVE
jgi:Spy/CpxP family protein refolding chaperone